MSLIYQYPLLYSGILLKRYKRFFADIELASGEVITAHCPNTGPMTGLYLPGQPVQVSRSDSPTRKLPYTWEMIEVTDQWVSDLGGGQHSIAKSSCQIGSRKRSVSRIRQLRHYSR